MDEKLTKFEQDGKVYIKKGIDYNETLSFYKMTSLL